MKTPSLKPALVVVVSLLLVLASAQTKAKPHSTHQISVKAANAVVLKKFPGKIVGKTKLENEEGKWQYGVLVMSKKVLREVMVDAKTGKIASVEVTDLKKEHQEAIEDAKSAKGAKKGAVKKSKKDDEDGEKEDK